MDTNAKNYVYAKTDIVTSIRCILYRPNRIHDFNHKPVMFYVKSFILFCHNTLDCNIMKTGLK